jgi:hypothetical protein
MCIVTVPYIICHVEGVGFVSVSRCRRQGRNSSCLGDQKQKYSNIFASKQGPNRVGISSFAPPSQVIRRTTDTNLNQINILKYCHSCHRTSKFLCWIFFIWFRTEKGQNHTHIGSSIVLFCKMFIVFYTVKNVSICAFMTCATSSCLCDTLMDPWNVCMYVCM